MATKTSAAVVKGLYEKRGWFYYQAPTPKGGKRPKAMALGTRNLMEALERVVERVDEVEQLVSVPGTLAEVLPRYYKAKGGDATVTRVNRESVLEEFKKVTGNPRVNTLDSRVIEMWRKYLDEKNTGRVTAELSASTIRSYIIILRAFLNWCVEQKLMRASPLAGMRREVRVTTTRIHGFLTEDEREKLLAAEQPDYVRLILMLGFFAGLRYGEMLAANPQWVWVSDDGKRGTLTVQETVIEYTDGKTATWLPKCRKRRTLPLHPRLLEFLQGYGIRSPWLLAPEKDKWPVDDLRSKRWDAKKALASVAKRAGVRKLTPHMLRHSFATHLSMKGVPLAEIAGLLGDSLRVTEEHYAGYQPGKGNPLGCL